jgi:hypothetical protein
MEHRLQPAFGSAVGFYGNHTTNSCFTEEQRQALTLWLAHANYGKRSEANIK